MTGFQIITLLVSLTAFTGFLNQRVFRLRGSLGLAVSGAAVSGLVVLLSQFIPGAGVKAARLFAKINFAETVFHGMLCFLLFASAMHIDLKVLKRWKITITCLATVGVAISALVVAGVAWLLCEAAGFHIPFVWLLVWGSLISPTDPIAVLALLKELGASEDLEAKIAGESLLNDGTGLVLFSIFLGMATNQQPSVSDSALFFVREAFGGICLGIVLGMLGSKLIELIDDAATEVAMTLAFALGGFAIGEGMHVSAPLATAVMGLIIGQRKKSVMSEETRARLLPFWEMFDELLNMALFALVGLALVAVSFTWSSTVLSLAAIACALVGRIVSVSVPMGAITYLIAPQLKGTIMAVTWGGLRGGLSLALALSLPGVQVQESDRYSDLGRGDVQPVGSGPQHALVSLPVWAGWRPGL